MTIQEPPTQRSAAVEPPMSRHYWELQADLGPVSGCAEGVQNSYALREAYPPCADGCTLFTFRRLFMIVRRA